MADAELAALARTAHGVVTRRGIPTVTVARCLVELAGVLDTEGLAAACHEAGVRFATTRRGPPSPGHEPPRVAAAASTAAGTTVA